MNDADVEREYFFQRDRGPEKKEEKEKKEKKKRNSKRDIYYDISACVCVIFKRKMKEKKKITMTILLQNETNGRLTGQRRNDDGTTNRVFS